MVYNLFPYDKLELLVNYEKRDLEKMKKITIYLLSFVLLLESVAFFAPRNVAAASLSKPIDTQILADKIGSIQPGDTDLLPALEYNNLEVITETEEKSEYIMTIDGVKVRYVEDIIKVSANTTTINTKAYNNETNELIQDYSTTITDDKIVEQNLYLLGELPEPKVKKNEDELFALANTKSNSSLVKYMGINYTKNFTTGRGRAQYASLPSRTASLTSKAFDVHATTVDSMRNVENGTIVGMLTSAFSGGGLVAGKLISWTTAKVILKNIAGPVAVATNAWALSQWVFYYNRLENNYNKIK